MPNPGVAALRPPVQLRREGVVRFRRELPVQSKPQNDNEHGRCITPLQPDERRAVGRVEGACKAPRREGRTGVLGPGLENVHPMTAMLAQPLTTPSQEY